MMDYSGPSYKIDYNNNHFDSAAELCWYLFISGSGITGNVVSQPLAYKRDLPWYPDLSFPIIIPHHFKIYVEVKPLSKDRFEQDLDLKKYNIRDSITCICGQTYLDYLVMSQNEAVKQHFDRHFMDKQQKWKESKYLASDFAHTYGTLKKSEIKQKIFFVPTGKYKGMSYEELKQTDIDHYNKLIDDYDPIV